jgi:hypothetical protein
MGRMMGMIEELSMIFVFVFVGLFWFPVSTALL